MQRFPLPAIGTWGNIEAPIGFAIGMIAGTAGYFSLSFEPDPALIAILTGICWGACLCGRRWSLIVPVMTLLIMLSGAGAGLASGSFATWRTQHVAIEQPVGPVLLEGWVVEAQPAQRGVRLVVRVHALDGHAMADTPTTVRVTHILPLNTEPGRFVRCWAVLRPPPQPVIAGDYNFARQAWFSRFGGVGYVQGRCRGGALGAPSGGMASAELSVAKGRRTLARYVNAAAGERAGGFAAALASGDRSFMRPEDQEALRGSGLAHLLAISGLHMGIVGGLVFLALRRGLGLIEPLALRISVRKPAAFGALMACAAYLVLSGGSISTQRAFIMAAVAFGAVLIDRAALSMRSLSIAMTAILILAPWSVLTPGFQMSFSATAALIATYEMWRARQDWLGYRPSGVMFWLKSLIVTSIVSSAATAPFALFHFDRVAGLGVLANLAAMPIISLVSAPLAGVALLLAPIGLDGWALRGFGLSLEALLAVAHTFSGSNAASPGFPPMPELSLVIFVAAIAICTLSLSGRWKAAIMLMLAGAGALIWGGSATDRIHWAPSGELFLEHASGRVEKLAIRDGEGLAPLRFADRAGTSSGRTEHCFYEFGGARIQVCDEHLMRDHGAPASISISPASDENAQSHPIIIHWQDVLYENGVTLERRGGAFVKKRKPACGQRAWHPCPVELP
ncbi:MAG: ComEC/Rec2 family competence protein [Pseudomonadota bacterium]